MQFRNYFWSVLAAGFLSALPLTAQTDYATPYAFSTFAGVASVGRTDGPGLQARFNRPGGLTIDAAGNLYVADTYNHTIRKITPDGIVSTLAGKAGSTGDVDGLAPNARFWFPNSIAADRSGNLFVADSSNNRIRKIATDGSVSTVAGTAKPGAVDGTGSVATFSHPEGLAVDRDGNIFVADTNSSFIRRITPAGVVSTFQTVFATDPSITNPFWNTRFFYPQGIAVDLQGNLYIANKILGGIHKMSPDGTVTLFAGDPRPGVQQYTDGIGTAAHFFGPRGIIVDDAGVVRVVDERAHTIRQILPDRTVTTLAGAASVVGDTDGPAASARFMSPSGIARDASGNVFISESGNNLIRRLSPSGTVTTIAGLSVFESAGATDGPAANARFFQPSGMVATADGVLYVADRGNHTIRRIASNGEVSTVAGEAGTAGYVDGDAKSARFSSPAYLALDPAGNLFVSDTTNNVIRKITPTGVVSTVAGIRNQYGVVDGPVTSATFYGLSGIAVDASGNLLVVDGQRSSSAVLRKVGVDGQVSTLVTIYTGPRDPDGQQEQSFYQSSVVLDNAGNCYVAEGRAPGIIKISTAGQLTHLPLDITTSSFARDQAGNLFVIGEGRVAVIRPDGTSSLLAGGTSGSADGVGLDAQFVWPTGIAVDSSGNLYISDSSEYTNTIRKGRLATAPVIAQQPQNLSLVAGANGTLTVTAGGAPDPTYQWYFKNAPISGATTNSYAISNAQSSTAGDYSVTVTNAVGTVTSTKANVTVTATPASPAPSSSGGGASGMAFSFTLAALALARQIARRYHRGYSVFI